MIHSIIKAGVVTQTQLEATAYIVWLLVKSKLLVFVMIDIII